MTPTIKTPSILKKIATAALEFKDAYTAGNELEAYRQLSHSLDAVRTHTSVKISTWSDGQDEEAAEDYNITVMALGDNSQRKEIVHGYSAQGLYRAVLNAKWLERMGKYSSVRILLTFHGVATCLPNAQHETARALADTKDELTDLAAWCRDFMKAWE